MKIKRRWFFVFAVLFFVLVSACYNPFYSDKRDDANSPEVPEEEEEEDDDDDDEVAGTNYAPSVNIAGTVYRFVFPGNLS